VSLRNAQFSLSPCHDRLFAGRYYRLVMYHYALALRRSSFLMVNSSWTKNHIDAILAHSDPLLDLIHLPLTFAGSLALSVIHTLALSSPARAHATPKRALIVYPPCDTLALSHFPLDGRPSLLLSLAQFRYDFRLFFPALHVH
jgi:alpha-1,2-mannosyltransferase